MEELSGYSKEEILSMDVLRLRPKNEHLRVRQIFEEVKKKGVLRRIDDTHILTKDGRLTPVEWSTRLVELEGGRVVFSILRDITLRKKLEKESQEREKDLTVLNEVATEISSRLEIEDLLKRIADDAIRITDSDSSVIALYDRQKKVFTFSYVKNLPQSLTKKDPGKGISAIVLKEKRPLILEDYSKVEEAIPEFVEAGLKGSLAVPIMAKEQIYGVLVAFKFKSYKYSEREVQLLQSVAKQAAVAIENARLYGELKETYQKERYVADSLSRSLLPPALPKIPHTELGIYYLSATPKAYVGGDFYDFMKIDNKVVLVVGDISGKGIEVASLTAMARNVIRTLIYQGYPVNEVLNKANRIVYKEVPKDFFIALSYYLYDWPTGEITFINAGQRHAYYCLDHVSCEFIETWEPALGILPAYDCKSKEMVLGKGDILAIYTDGLVEVKRDNKYFEQQLPRFIFKYSELGAQTFTNKIIEELKKFSPQEELPDDVVLLVIKRTE